MSYVKYSDVSDSIAAIMDQLDTEEDPDKRKESINSVMQQLSVRLSDTLGKCCYELKRNGVATDIISIDLQISQRQVLRLIRAYAARNNVASPLDRISIDGFIDIRDLVTFDN
jgi:hypothetical protein